MTKDEALKLALEALEEYHYGEARIILLQALEQPVQEPVARVAEVHMSRYTIEWTNGLLPEGTELFAAPTPPLPVQRQPLTDGGLLKCLVSVDPETKRLPPGLRDFARAIEAAHNIGAKP